MAIRRETVNITAAGSAGTSSGSARTANVVQGVILDLYIDYDASAPSTVDLTVAEGNESPAAPILTLANTNTDQWIAPRQVLVDSSDGSALTGPVDYVAAADHLLVSIAQANDGDEFAVTIRWDDMQ